MSRRQRRDLDRGGNLELSRQFATYYDRLMQITLRFSQRTAT